MRNIWLQHKCQRKRGKRVLKIMLCMFKGGHLKREPYDNDMRSPSYGSIRHPLEIH